MLDLFSVHLDNPFTVWSLNRYATSDPSPYLFPPHLQPLSCHVITLCQSEAYSITWFHITDFKKDGKFVAKYPED